MVKGFCPLIIASGMMGDMFQTFIVQPIYNLLVAIYGLLPGHDLGLSLVIFTVLVRLALWPLLKKQLHQSKVMRELQPELKKIKVSAGGDRQKEAAMMMELYKERGISPFGSIGLTLIQLPIFIGVFHAARLLTEQLPRLNDLTYSFIHNIPHVSQVIDDPSKFNFVSLGFIDLSKKAFSGGVYWPIFVIAVAATVLQYVQAKQLMPQAKEKKRLRDILRAQAETGKAPDQEDMSAAMGRSMLFFMPILTMLFALYAQGAMVVYLLASSVIGILQQKRIFKKDTEEMEAEVLDVKKQPASKTTSQNVAELAEKLMVTEKVNKGKVVTKTRIITAGSSPAPKKAKKRRKR